MSGGAPRPAWTEAEDAALRASVAEGLTRDQVVAAWAASGLRPRSAVALGRRMQALGLLKTTPPPPAWSEAEEACLRDLFTTESDPKDLAVALAARGFPARVAGAIEQRIKKLKLAPRKRSPIPWSTAEVNALKILYHPGSSPAKVAEALALQGFPRREPRTVALRASKLGLTARRGQQAPEVAAAMQAEIVELREGLKHAWDEVRRLREENRVLRARLPKNA